MRGRIYYIVPLAILLTMVGLFVCDNQVLAQVCGVNDLSTLQPQCLKFVQKSGLSENPSKGCCKEVREIDVQCMCDDLLSDNSIAQLLINQLNLEKVVSVAKFCGKQLPSGKKMWKYNHPIICVTIEECEAKAAGFAINSPN